MLLHLAFAPPSHASDIKAETNPCAYQSASDVTFPECLGTLPDVRRCEGNAVVAQLTPKYLLVEVMPWCQPLKGSVQHLLKKKNEYGLIEEVKESRHIFKRCVWFSLLESSLGTLDR